MSLTPSDGPTIRDSGGQSSASSASQPSLTGRERFKSLAVSVQRGLGRRRRSLAAFVRSIANRVFSPGLSSTERDSFADGAAEPPSCPPVDSFPDRAFPVTYPTRAYRFVDNDADLVAEQREHTLTISHPDVAETWIQSDTWVQIRR